MKDTVALRRLTLMLDTLRSEYFQNRASCMEWQQHMEEYHGLGWSRAAFMRRLRVLKAKGCLIVVGEGTAAPGIRTSQGEVYAATDITPETDTTEMAESGETRNHSQPFTFGDDRRGHETSQIGSAIPKPVSELPRQSHESEGGKSLAELAMQQLARLSRGK
jgi:hypothetical protein